jgi:integrase
LASAEVRATLRGEQPIKPDAYLLHHVATILLDCGLRPEECYRLKPEYIQDGGINIPSGKGKGSRRRVLCTPRVQAILEMRRAARESAEDEVRRKGAEEGASKDEISRRLASQQWIFPRNTKSGHITGVTIRDQHEVALEAAGLSGIVFYDFRHTRITRWAKVHPLPHVQRMAGHTSITTTMRYVHVSEDDVIAAMKSEEEARAVEAQKRTSEGQGSDTNRYTEDSTFGLGRKRGLVN